MSLPFPEPAIPVSSRTAVVLGYLDYFWSRLVSKLEAPTERRAAAQSAAVRLDADRASRGLIRVRPGEVRMRRWR